MNVSLYAFYAAPLLLTMIWYLRRHFRAERISREVHQEAKEAGLLEPASLHPSIDPARCLGCRACVRACPEQPHLHVLALIPGKANFLRPTDSIEDGACTSRRPVAAITLS